MLVKCNHIVEARAFNHSTISIAVHSSTQNKELIGCAIDHKLIVVHKLSEPQLLINEGRNAGLSTNTLNI